MKAAQNGFMQATPELQGTRERFADKGGDPAADKVFTL